MKYTKLAALVVLGAVLATLIGVSSAGAATYKTKLSITVPATSSNTD